MRYNQKKRDIPPYLCPFPSQTRLASMRRDLSSPKRLVDYSTRVCKPLSNQRPFYANNWLPSRYPNDSANKALFSCISLSLRAELWNTKLRCWNSRSLSQRCCESHGCQEFSDSPKRGFFFGILEIPSAPPYRLTREWYKIFNYPLGWRSCLLLPISRLWFILKCLTFAKQTPIPLALLPTWQSDTWMVPFIAIDVARCVIRVTGRSSSMQRLSHLRASISSVKPATRR